MAEKRIKTASADDSSVLFAAASSPTYTGMFSFSPASKETAQEPMKTSSRLQESLFGSGPTSTIVSPTPDKTQQSSPFRFQPQATATATPDKIRKSSLFGLEPPATTTSATPDIPQQSSPFVFVPAPKSTPTRLVQAQKSESTPGLTLESVAASTPSKSKQSIFGSESLFKSPLALGTTSITSSNFGSGPATGSATGLASSKPQQPLLGPESSLEGLNTPGTTSIALVPSGGPQPSAFRSGSKSTTNLASSNPQQPFFSAGSTSTSLTAPQATPASPMKQPVFRFGNSHNKGTPYSRVTTSNALVSSSGNKQSKHNPDVPAPFTAFGKLSLAPTMSPSQQGKASTPPSSGSSEAEDNGQPEHGSNFQSDSAELLYHHLDLLKQTPEKGDFDELVSTPLFTLPILKHAETLTARSAKPTFPQYALLAGNVDVLQGSQPDDPRIFYNVAAPSSAFICGSQGSGKSHTLSCFLESCLLPSKLGPLPRPLTGLVFHYDTFISDSSGAPCEAAYLASNPNVKVRVLAPPSNIQTLKKTYSHLPNVKVRELRLDESDLNTKRMLDLMGAGEGNVPLYMHVVQRILRELRIAQQASGGGFRYQEFQRKIMEDLTSAQLGPLRQRLDTLESFMVQDQIGAKETLGLDDKTRVKKSKGTDWTPKEGQLIILDLSCPCITPEMGCSLFNICLQLFLEQSSSVGRVVALDEAHKYMGDSAECEFLTNSLLSIIRLQRHLGIRVIISTQEPTISPKLLDLCSITIVHRFTSPDWLRVLKLHLAGISTASKIARRLDKSEEPEGTSIDGVKGITVTSEDPTLELFSRIVALKTGEALLFAPNAIVSLEKPKDSGTFSRPTLKRLTYDVLHVRIRGRLTADGGRSIFAS